MFRDTCDCSMVLREDGDGSVSKCTQGSVYDEAKRKAKRQDIYVIVRCTPVIISIVCVIMSIWVLIP